MGETVARLKRRADFLKVAGARRKWVAPGLIVQARRRDPGARKDNDPGARKGNDLGAREGNDLGAREGKNEVDSALVRVGFTVSRKVGNAVQRNRARRRLRAAAGIIEKGVAQGRVAGGVDLVVIGRAETLTRPFPELIDDLTLALKRLDVWRNGGTEPEKTTKRTR